MDELGPLRVGINRTQYRWDGTDDFGNKLGNGVYLMKAIGDSEFFDGILFFIQEPLYILRDGNKGIF